MFSVNGPCFLQIANERNQRLLVPGKVSELRDGQVVAQFDDPAAINPGDNAIILAEVRQKFLQQSATIQRVWIAPPTDETNIPVLARSAKAETPVIEFLPIGQPVSAEQRGSYRVSVAAANLFATVGPQLKCQVVDVSPEGLAVICGDLTIGQRVNVAFEQGGIVLDGQMTVQTCKTTRSGKLRFGLYAPDRKATIRMNLERLTMLMQREQLKRFAGAA